jgi:uncharacterized membrane protein YkvA (DUF1232 family)
MSKELIPESNRPKRTILGTLVAVAVAMFCVVYMLNPTAGFFEFIPDSIPFIGNVDEGLIMLLFLACLKYLGIDIPLGKSSRDAPPKQ